MPLRAAGFAFLLALHAAAAAQPVPQRSGIEFQGESVRAMQADAFGNPGMLWVERGERLWNEPRGAGRACAACHGSAAQSMKGVAARHPRHDPSIGRVVNLEERINACVTRNQKAEALAWESEGLLSLTAHVAAQSRRMPISPDAGGASAEVLERGRALWVERQGQLHLACTQCHDARAGATLLEERISQGHPADWPAYRLEWQSLGSLQRRLRACYYGVRAEMPPFGSPDLLALELYLAARARGLGTSPPGVRR